MENNTQNNGTPESQNTANAPKKDKENLKQEFLKKFKENINSKNENEKIKFFNVLFEANDLNPNLKDYLTDFQTENDEKNEYKQIINEISFFELKDKFITNLRDIQIKRTQLEKIILDEVENSSINYNSQIFYRVKYLPNSNIDTLIKDKKVRKEFLNNLGIKTKIKLASNSPNLFTNKLQTKINELLLGNKLKDDEKEKLKQILTTFGIRNKAEKLDDYLVATLDDLIQNFKHVFDEDFKKLIICEFLPYLSLKDAYNKNLITEEEYKNKILAYLREKNITDNEEVKKQIEDLNRNGIDRIVLLDTKDLLKNSTNIDRILSKYSYNIAENFAKDWNLDFEEAEIEYKNGGPKNFEILQLKLKKLPNITNADKFAKGNIIEIKLENGTKEGIRQFFRIKSKDDEKKEFVLEKVGENKTINLKINGEGTSTSYADFLGSLQKSSSILTCLTENDIKEKIRDLELQNSDLNLYDINDLQNESRKQKYLEKYNLIKAEKLEKLNKEKEKLDKDKEKDKIAEIDKEIEELENEFPNNPDNDTLLDKLNFSELITKIDEIDPEGKGISLAIGTYLDCENAKMEPDKNGNETRGKALFKIIGISNNKIDIIGIRGDGVECNRSSIGYLEFYETFKDFKAKRLKNAGTFEEFFKDLQANQKGWSGFEYKDGKIQATEKEEGYNSQIAEYLVSDESDEIIKIEKIDGGKVQIRHGTRKKRGDLDKKDKNYIDKQKEEDKRKDKNVPLKADQEVISLSSSIDTISTTELNKFIKETKGGLKPDIKVGQNYKPEQSNNKFNGGMLGAFSWRSINDLISGPKRLYQGIIDYFKRGNDLRAAKFALAMGSWLPQELKYSLQMKVEGEEKENMEKDEKQLMNLDSRVATEVVEKRILNKNTPDYKIEAAMMYMLEKYGHLCAKKMAKYRGKFIWYERLGGKIGDKLYREQKEKAEKDGITFSEEKLCRILLLLQCEDKGYNGKHRRGMLYKEYDAKWQVGIKAELEKGYSDADKKRTFNSMLEGFYGEFRNGTSTNSIGWMKRMVGLGGSLEEMTEPFFVWLASGAIYDVDEKTFLEFKKYWLSDGMPIPAAALMTKKPDMDLFNKTIVALSKEMEKADPKEYSGMGAEAEKLYKNTLDSQRKNIKEKDRIDQAKDFWKNHGKALSRALNMADVAHVDKGISTTYTTDKILLLKKDENTTLKSYYDAFNGDDSLGSPKTVFNKDYLSDTAGGAGMIGFLLKKAKKALVVKYDGSFDDANFAKSIWNQISKDINSVKNQTNLSKKDRKTYLKDTLGNLIGGVLLQVASDNKQKELLQNNAIVRKDLKDWGLNLMELEQARINDSLSKKIDEITQNILDGKNDDNNFSKSNPMDLIKGQVQQKVNKSISIDDE